MGEKPPEGNLIFKKTSEDDFLADLAACRYVIANGGHSLISEALYLGSRFSACPFIFSMSNISMPISCQKMDLAIIS